MQQVQYFFYKFFFGTVLTADGVQNKWKQIRETFTRAHRAHLNSKKLSSLQREIFDNAQFLTQYTTHKNVDEEQQYYKVVNDKPLRRADCDDDRLLYQVKSENETFTDVQDDCPGNGLKLNAMLENNIEDDALMNFQLDHEVPNDEADADERPEETSMETGTQFFVTASQFEIDERNYYQSECEESETYDEAMEEDIETIDSEFIDADQETEEAIEISSEPQLKEYFAKKFSNAKEKKN